MLDLLLPETDAGVIAQLLLVLVMWLGGLWSLRNRPDARLVVAGAGLLMLGLIGLRALH